MNRPNQTELNCWRQLNVISDWRAKWLGSLCGLRCLLVARSRCELNNPCHHECIDDGVAIRCRCFDGFALQPDARTCLGICTPHAVSKYTVKVGGIYRVAPNIWHIFVKYRPIFIFFHCQNQEKICNSVITKDLITQYTSSVSLHYLVKCQWLVSNNWVIRLTKFCQFFRVTLYNSWGRIRPPGFCHCRSNRFEQSSKHFKRHWRYFTVYAKMILFSYHCHYVVKLTVIHVSLC